jgi:hypothetical protein
VRDVESAAINGIAKAGRFGDGLAMGENVKSGCWKLAAGGALLVVIVVGLLVFGLIRWFAAEDDLVMDERGKIRIEAEDLPEFEPLKPGETVTRNRYLVAMLDETRTDLARQAFRERADGAPTEWRMILADISETDAGPVASLFVDYEIIHTMSSQSSRLEVTAAFDPARRDALLELRRGEPVTVAGTLSLDGAAPRILDARIVAEEP